MTFAQRTSCADRFHAIEAGRCQSKISTAQRFVRHRRHSRPLIRLQCFLETFKLSEKGIDLLSEGAGLSWPLADCGMTMTDIENGVNNLEPAAWSTIRRELSILFADLFDDPVYSERVKHLAELLGDDGFSKEEQINFPPN